MKKETRRRKSTRPLELRSGPTSNWDHIRSAGIFQAALEAEQLGPHPGYADIRIRMYVYNPRTKREEALPGKKLELLISNYQEVNDSLQVMRKSLEEWIAGFLRVQR